MPHISDIDRIRLAEAFRIADKLQDHVWTGWHTAPFAVLLVTPEYEFLVCHPDPTKEFLDAGYDRLLKSWIYYRKRQFDNHLLATFPAVNGLSTKDYTPYSQVAAYLHDSIANALTRKSLEQAQRSLFYVYGAAQALVLDAANPKWQQRYLQEKCRLDIDFAPQ